MRKSFRIFLGGLPLAAATRMLVRQLCEEFGNHSAEHCWNDPRFTCEVCCQPLNYGQDFCWDEGFDYEKCCPDPSLKEIWVPNNPCSRPQVRHFEEQVRAYYATNISSPDLPLQYATFMRAFPDVEGACAPAALMVMLLKTEESVYLERTETQWQAILKFYKRNYPHKSNQRWRKEWARWPIAHGMWRARELRNQWDETRVALAPRKTVDLIVVICDEVPFWLEMFHNMRIHINDDYPDLVKEYVSVRFYLKCGDDKFWAKLGGELVDQWSYMFKEATWHGVYA